MAKKPQPQPAPEIDLDALMHDLHSIDDAMRARAVRSICPCRLGWDAFQHCMDTVKQLQKDPNPAVRAAALHVFKDAYGMDSRGLPTSPQEMKNEMLARKRQMRWRSDDMEEDILDRSDRDANRRQREQERARKRQTSAAFGRSRNSPVSKQ
jgi:hypothetical protein